MFPLTLLKYIVENAIYELLILKKENILLTFQDLTNFYTYAKLPNKDLSQKKTILERILSLKNTASIEHHQ